MESVLSLLRVGLGWESCGREADSRGTLGPLGPPRSPRSPLPVMWTELPREDTLNTEPHSGRMLHVNQQPARNCHGSTSKAGRPFIRDAVASPPPSEGAGVRTLGQPQHQGGGFFSGVSGLSVQPVLCSTTTLRPVVLPVVRPVVLPVVRPVVLPVVRPVVLSVVRPVVLPVVRPVVLPVVRPVVLPVSAASGHSQDLAVWPPGDPRARHWVEGRAYAVSPALAINPGEKRKRKRKTGFSSYLSVVSQRTTTTGVKDYNSHSAVQAGGGGRTAEEDEDEEDEAEEDEAEEPARNSGESGHYQSERPRFTSQLFSIGRLSIDGENQLVEELNRIVQRLLEHEWIFFGSGRT
ncbi:hypothetical protein EYF80_041239 [Liparis tanakae]|uniref:Uncharacterized protein n=1 Tax=Liparis tanakae TaxID=230148 RepID=A0A4Z2G6K9_9TELE|nr:hypothetical protein EYF80_041239 [Liparis tanakae]